MTLDLSIPHDLARPAAWALLHFTWQGAAIAAVAAIVTSFVRSASTRYVLLVGALLLMVAAPLVTFEYYRGAEPALLALPILAATPARAVGPDVIALLVEAWLVGVVLFGGRAFGGFVLLEQMRERSSTPLDAALLATCRELEARLGIGRPVDYAHCEWLDAPAAIGWMRPIVFLPLSAVSGLSPSQLRAIIAHEAAHVRRLDALVNGLQVAIEAMLFYHPAVWWLSRRIRVERENCCDDVAVEVSGDAIDYARALTEMEERRAAPEHAMAIHRSPIAARVVRLLRSERGPIARTLLASVLCVALALAGGLGIYGVAYARRSNSVAQPSHRTAVHKGEARADVPLDVDTLIAFRLHDVTPEFIDELGKRGYADLDADALIAFRIHDVTPSFIDGLERQGYRHLAPDALVAMRLHGVTPDYIAGLRMRGVRGMRGDGRRRAALDAIRDATE